MPLNMMAAIAEQMDWQDANAVLDGTSEAETLEYLQHLSGRLGYEHGNLEFASMPEHVGGYMEANKTTDWYGDVTISGENIYLNEVLLDGNTQQREEGGLLSAVFGGRNDSRFYDDTADLLDTFYHEVIHGKQYRDIQDTSEAYTEEDLDALMVLHEGQAAYNADGTSYQDARNLYQEIMDGGNLEEYRVDVVYMQDGGDEHYDIVVTDRDDELSTEEIYDRVEEEGLTVDREKSYEIDYRDLDTKKYIDHLERVQDEIADGYAEIFEEEGEAALPTEYENAVGPALQDPSIDAQYGTVSPQSAGTTQQYASAS